MDGRSGMGFAGRTGRMNVVGFVLSGVLAALGTSSVGCGPRYDESTIKTPQERMLEQEELAYEEELAARDRKDEGAPVELDKPGEFDEQQAEMELKRATLSAETCPDVVGDPKMPTGNDRTTARGIRKLSYCATSTR